MKRVILIHLCFIFPITSFLNAQEDTAMHRKVYTEIQSTVGKMQKEKATASVDGLEFELDSWLQAGEIRKIVARVPGEDGDGSEEYYFKDKQLIFVFRHYAAAAEDGEQGAQVEDRFYLKDGIVFKWLGSDKKPVAAESEDFKSEAERLEILSATFVATIDRKLAAVGAVTMKGVFLGVDEGDYSHWMMKDEKGEEVSLFILNAEDAVHEVLDNPKPYLGKRCEVIWKKSEEIIPEAGGKMEVSQIFGVKWLER